MTIQSQNNNLNYLIHPTFTKVNRLFVFSFARTTTGDHRNYFSHYYVPSVSIRAFNVLIDGKCFFDFPVKDEEEAYEKNMSDDRNNDHTTGDLLDFAYFKKNYKLIAIDWSKHTNIKDPQQISFIARLLTSSGATSFSSLKNQKNLLLNFYKILQTSNKNGNSKNCKFIKRF